jgi:DNA invertase Pin-like site-specific DNA recombinase
MACHTLLGSGPPEERGRSVIEEVQRVVDAINAVRAIEDPVRRARGISELLKQQTEQDPKLREERRTIVLAMRAEEVPFRKIATELGVSVGTVQDIVRGHSGPWGNRAKKSEAEEQS